MPIIKNPPAMEQEDEAVQAQPESEEMDDSDDIDGGEESGPVDPDAERVILAGIKMLYDDASHAAVVEQLKAGANDPAGTIALTAFTLMQTLDEKAGGKIPEEALVAGAAGLLTEIVNLAQQSKALPVDDSTESAAMQRLVQLAIENGIIDQEDIQGLIESMPEEEVQRIVAEQEQIANQSAPKPEAAPPAAGAV